MLLQTRATGFPGVACLCQFPGRAFRSDTRSRTLPALRPFCALFTFDYTILHVFAYIISASPQTLTSVPALIGLIEASLGLCPSLSLLFGCFFPLSASQAHWWLFVDSKVHPTLVSQGFTQRVRGQQFLLFVNRLDHFKTRAHLCPRLLFNSTTYSPLKSALVTCMSSLERRLCHLTRVVINISAQVCVKSQSVLILAQHAPSRDTD